MPNESQMWYVTNMTIAPKAPTPPPIAYVKNGKRVVSETANF